MPQSGGLKPNTLYTLGELVNNTTFNLNIAVNDEIANVWMWTFSIGSTVPTITWPSVTWCDSTNTETVDGVVVPIIEPNKHYEISIMNEYGTIISADIPQTEVEP